MANFMIRFLLCNVFISGIVGILLIAKWVFRNNLSSRMQYNLWLLLLGLLAIHKYFDKRKKDKKNKNPRMVYFFDIEKCKCCPYRDGCYKEGAKKKTYTETIICDSHSEQVKFQETEHFKEKMRERYKIEAKNSELKHRHGYDVASSSGLICMEMQGAMTIFAVNLKRIIKLMNEK